ncbi:hypothetical protein BH10PSE4_BH10PSE4_10750 [soil metagenome]
MNRGSQRSTRFALMMSAAPVCSLCVVGFSLGLAVHGQALAADECGLVVGQAASCPPAVYPTGISYAPPSPITVTLTQTSAAAVSVTNGGIAVTTTGADDITLRRSLTGAAGATNPTLSVLNSAGAALNLASARGNIVADLSPPATNSGLLLRGQTDGVHITTGGTATVTSTNGSISGLNGSAIDITAGGAITVSTGATLLQATGGAAVSLIQTGPSGAINLSTAGAINATTYISGDGIFIGAQDPTNTDVINVAVGAAIDAGGAGVRVTSSGARNIGITTSTAASIVGQNDGIFARTSGIGTINVSTNANVVGDINDGGVGDVINLGTVAGNITLTTAAGTTLLEGGNSPPVGLPDKAVVSLTSTSGSITVNNAASLQNSNSAGITAANADGIFARTATGAINLTSSGAMGTATSLLGGSAIDAAVTAGSGDLVVTNSGILQSLGPAVISLTNSGAGALRLNSNGAVTGRSLFGVVTVGGSGASILNFGADVSAVNAAAVRATSDSGAIVATVASGVQLRGAAGLELRSNSGALSVTNGGTISTLAQGPSAPSALALNSRGAASVTNSAGGTITSVGGGVATPAVAFVNASQVVLSNSGAISSSNADYSGYAIGVSKVGGADASAITFTNAAGGSITGAFDNSTSTAVTFNNAGSWYTALSQTTFGATNTSTINNTGLIQIGAAGAAVSSTTFAGLATLNNNGVVSLSNGVAGDVLNISGAYVGGAGAQLKLDVAGANVSDRLQITGAATGATTVLVNVVGSTAVFSKTTIVQAASSSSPTAFALPSGTLRQGLVQYGIAFDAGAYSLVQVPDTAAIEIVKFAEIRRNAFDKGEEAWSSHLDHHRDDGVDEGVSVWGQAFGGDASYDATRTFAPLGVQTTYRLDYDQRQAGAQFGVDFIQALDNGSAILGVTGGYVTTRAKFKETGDHFNIDGFNIGAYGVYAPGSWFLNALLRYDRGDGDVVSPYASYRQALNTSQVVATVEAGKRLHMGGWFVEPMARASVGRGFVARHGDGEDLSGYGVQGVVVELGDDDSVKGSLAVRVGSEPKSAFGGVLTPYVRVALVNEFAGKDKVTFNPTGENLSVSNKPVKAYGDFRAGARLVKSGGTDVVAELGGIVGSDVKGASLRVSVRHTW